MKKILTGILIFSIIYNYIFSFYTVNAQKEFNKNNYFIVTAYYSPLPNQQYYITGNYKDELILNGKWIAGASGEKVFSGMLAAPWKYPFGTKIYLDGLGIGSVEDRGGAIVQAGKRWYNYDRIDVWVGYGEEGLRRALFWWKRKVYGYIVDNWRKTSIDYNIIPSPKWATDGLKKKQKKLANIFDISLWLWSEESLIKQLQEILEKLWFLEKNYNTGVYDNKTINAVYDFQVKNKILSKASDPWAGSYGPKTRKSLKRVYQEYLAEELRERSFFIKLEEIKKESLLKAKKHVQELEKPRYGEISPRVRKLQKTLASLGFFDYKDTAIFWVKTQNSLIDYQISNKIISNSSAIGAWVFGPKTRIQLQKDLSNIYFDALLIENKLLESYEKYVVKRNIEVHENEHNNVSIIGQAFKI